jgi:hypothetical protein
MQRKLTKIRDSFPMQIGVQIGETIMELFRKFNQAEGAAYYAFADVMRRLEWDIHNVLWRDGIGLPGEWREMSEDLSGRHGPKERVTLLVDKRVTKFFRATGTGFQARMNDVMLAFVLAKMAHILKGAQTYNLAKSAAENDVRGGNPPMPGATRAEEIAHKTAIAAFFAQQDAEKAAEEAPGLRVVPRPDDAG